jgi:hypothetical protein
LFLFTMRDAFSLATLLLIDFPTLPDFLVPRFTS